MTNPHRWQPRAAALLLAVAAVSSSAVFSQEQRAGRRLTTVLVDGREAVAGEVLVRFRDPQATFERTRAEQQVDADDVETVGRRGLRRMHSRRLGTHALLALLRANPDVELVEPNFVIHIDALPNDPSFSNMWGLLNTAQNIGGVGKAGADIDAPLAWDVATGSRTNVVGVIDTGVDYNHVDLAANIWSAPSAFSVTVGGVVVNCAAGTHGFNAITNTCNPMDDNNHGTHVSGTIGAVGNNGVGVTGVNWTASIMGLKFLDSSGSGSTANAIKAIEFAIQAKAAFAASGGANIRVLSNSWGGTGYSQSLLDAINRANTSDMLFVAAAGNAGSNNDIYPSYPAAFTAPNMVTVAATDNTDQRASFSSYGASSVHLGAPGVYVLSTTRNNGYAYFSGTSMATPHVAGAAALLLSRCALTTAELKGALLTSVDPIPSMTGVTTTGGRLNVNNAIRSCRPIDPPVLAASPAAVAAGSAVTVTWQKIVPPTGTDWVGLYATGAADGSPVAWWYTTGAAAGNRAVTMPLSTPSGVYEFRLFAQNGFNRLAVSNTVNVTGQAATLTAGPSPIVAGAALTAVWQGIAAPTATDWIGLYAAGAADGSPVTWWYTSGLAADSRAYTVPLSTASGLYQLRLFSHNGFNRLAVSNNVTVAGIAASLSAAPSSVATGGTLTATWQGIAAPDATDWLGLYAVSANDYTPVAWWHTSGLAADSLAVTVPASAAPGTYEFRLFARNGFTRLAVSNTVTVTGVTAALSASPSPVASGGALNVTWLGIAAPTATDWFGLYAVGAADGSPVAWWRTSGTAAGSLGITVPASTPSGAYELRLFAQNGFNRLAVSSGITVVGTATTLSASPSPVGRGGSLTINWQGIAAPTATDWVGLYAVNATDDAPVAWWYTTGAAVGSRAITVPSSTAPGQYEVRLFAQNGFSRLAVSNRVAVQ